MGMPVAEAILHLLSVTLFIIILLLDNGVCQPDPCPPFKKCNRHGPEIRFPFGLKEKKEDQQHQHCRAYPGFDLSCNGTNTVLNLPSSAEVFVTDINYTSQTLSISADPQNCIEGLLFNLKLNLSASLFHPWPEYYNYYTDCNCTFLNCSSDDSSDYFYGVPIECLSGSQYNVFLEDGDEGVTELPFSCEPIKTFKCPLDWYQRGDPYLKWDVPGCGDCETRGERCGFKNITGDEITCFFIPPTQGSSDEKYIIIGVSIGIFVLILATLISIKVYIWWKTDRKDIENQLEIEKFLEDYKSMKPTRYSYADLKKMTDQFKEKLGQGGYGSVFKGKLPSEVTVAVKLLQNSGGNGEDFINEVGTIGRIHHVNVVRLLGFCVDRFRRALIYEFMPNESLEKFIFSADAKDPVLGWEKLQDIALGVAKGIEYLHQGCEQRILHFDIKPHNILLDHNFNPKISDFGLAKLCPKEQSIVSMKDARGTMGYIAPEVFSRNFGNVSYKSDVYSFGMLLLEMVGGRKNIDATVENTSEVYFPEWVYNKLSQGDGLRLRIEEDGDAEIAKQLTKVALWCIQSHPADRPSMKNVLQMLEGSTDSLMMPPYPFASSGPQDTNVALPEETHGTKLTTIHEIE
ncbi:rust resistance kinase Lr10-like isoform X1 [Tasmannia lanceolata]|uniref:rust resistance kinase Lr10-like isoform X1 n=1 Tax=Tasmannia lanceolata TaxID=3420 RepID=UPI004063ED8B